MVSGNGGGPLQCPAGAVRKGFLTAKKTSHGRDSKVKACLWICQPMADCGRPSRFRVDGRAGKDSCALCEWWWTHSKLFGTQQGTLRVPAGTCNVPLRKAPPTAPTGFPSAREWQRRGDDSFRSLPRILMRGGNDATVWLHVLRTRADTEVCPCDDLQEPSGKGSW